MNRKIERILEQLEHYKSKEAALIHSVDRKSNNARVSFGKILAFNDAIMFIKSEMSDQLCECAGNERIALDCTMKPCKHPKYYNK